jgi:hypothetical protein
VHGIITASASRGENWKKREGEENEGINGERVEIME